MGHQLDALTLRDALTGLYTHRAFQERLREEIARALRYGQPMSLLIADIDGFASVNYDLGYQVGDEILRRIARRAPGGRLARSRAHVRRRRALLRRGVRAAPARDREGRRDDEGRHACAMRSARPRCRAAASCRCRSASRRLPDDAADPEGLLTAAEAALRGAKRGGRAACTSSPVTIARRGVARRRRGPFGKAIEVDRFRPYQERMHEVTAILKRDRSLSCLLVDLSRLHKVELDLGVAHHSEIYDHAAAVLDRLRGAVLDPADLDLPHRRRRRLPRDPRAARPTSASISRHSRRPSSAPSRSRCRRWSATCCASSRASRSARRACSATR